MLRINYWLQTVLVSLGLLLLGLYFFNEAFLFFLALVQAVVGTIQYFASIMLALYFGFQKRALNIYLITANFYLIFLVILGSFITEDELIRYGFLFGLPWILAIYFWYLSRELKNKAL